MYHKTILQLAIAATILFLVFAFFFVYLVVLQRRKRIEHYSEKQQLLLQLQNKELKMGMEEREIILREMSRDVHDNIGPLANFIQMNLQAVEELGTSPEQHVFIARINQLLDVISQNIAHFGRSFNSEYVKSKGLCRLLEDDAEHIRATTKMECYIDIDGDDTLLTPEQQLMTYRIAQEAVQNIFRHAEATVIEFNLVFGPHLMSMSIKDNGHGFDQDHLGEKGGIGLNNMKSRAALLDGSLEIKSTPDRGTCITLTLSGSAIVRK